MLSLSFGALILLVPLVVAFNTRELSPHWHHGRENRASAERFKFHSVDRYKGHDFLNETHWSFFTEHDPTQGQVKYLSRHEAEAHRLAYVRHDGKTVLRVDSSKDLPHGKERDSVRIASTKQFHKGLVIADFDAMPHGCAVWAAWWAVGLKWPDGGEIDIVEGVNSKRTNQYTFHSGSDGSCHIPPRINKHGEPAFAAEVLSTNCMSSERNDGGCALSDTKSSSFGKGFNSVGGGVFALLRENENIKIWHFERHSIPPDVHSGKPKPHSWPRPSAMLAADHCDIDSHFHPQTLVLDIDLCGNWGKGTYSSLDCPGTCSQHVAKGKNFIHASWVINSITIYHS
ncbi:concanavalin A-like lectin/glucanase domain-containing protein [Russula compacta]|nr:concanavalin A-like lectin/glucanase domain-containing protein [Russula compacta]